jgi:hypothetical protein
LGIVLVILGPAVLSAGMTVVETAVVSYETMAVNTTGTLDIEVTADMQPPIFMYYVLQNYYGMHRRIVKSRNDNQMSGPPKDYPTAYRQIVDCEPLASIYAASDDRSKLPANFYFPCGLVTWNRFNDSFQDLQPKGCGGNCSIYLNKTGIAWPDDIKTKYHNPPTGASPGQLPPGVTKLWDFEDPDFIVWMRTNPAPKFRNLYRIIREPLKKGTYTLTVNNNFGISNITKGVLLTTLGPMGGKNRFLGVASLIWGLACLLFAIWALLKTKLHKEVPSPTLSGWFGTWVMRPSGSS